MNEIEDAVIVSETVDKYEFESSVAPVETQKFTPEQIHNMKVMTAAYKAAIGKSKRKKGAKHEHNPSGSKLSRKLARTGSLY